MESQTGEMMIKQSEIQEFVDMNDIGVLTGLQKEHQLLATQMELAAAKIEIVRLKLKAKYNLNDQDTVNSSNGLITRV